MNATATSESSVWPRRGVERFAEPSTALDATVDLLARIQHGDEAALGTLINRYLPSLRRIANHRLSGHARLMNDTDDIVQEALVNTVRRLPHFVCRKPGALLAYFRRAVYNRIIDARRKRRPEGEWMALPDDCAGPDASPLQRVLDKEEIRRYRAALLRLKSRDRQLILLRVEQGLTYQEIGTRLRMPSPNAARVASVRAIARLASALEHV